MKGYLDPAVVATTGKERAALAEIRRRGLSVHRTSGGALRITGPGVFLLVAGLAGVAMIDLAPATEREARLLQMRYG